MERKASYAIIGFLTLALMAGLGGFSYWFIQSGFNSVYADYQVHFDFPVDGLNRGAEVHFNGIKVGEVTELKLGKDDSRRVIATVKVDAETPIMADSEATLEPQGVTGLAYINISPGTKKSKRLIYDPLKPLPVIKGVESRLSKLLSGSGSVIQDVFLTLNRVNLILSDENINSLTKSLNNLEALTEDLSKREQLINDAHAAILSASEAADAVTALANSSEVLIREDAPLTLSRINSATEDLSSAAKAVEQLALEIKEPVGHVQETTLPKLEQSLHELDEATRALKMLADEARQSPQAFAAKGEARERKLSP